MIHKATITAMIIHVTTTDSLISSNPFKNGIFMTVSHCSSSSNLSVKLPVSLPPFLYQIVIYDKVPFNKKKLLILGTKKELLSQKNFCLIAPFKIVSLKSYCKYTPTKFFCQSFVIAVFTSTFYHFFMEFLFKIPFIFIDLFLFFMHFFSHFFCTETHFQICRHVFILFAMKKCEFLWNLHTAFFIHLYFIHLLLSFFNAYKYFHSHSSQ